MATKAQKAATKAQKAQAPTTGTPAVKKPLVATTATPAAPAAAPVATVAVTPAQPAPIVAPVQPVQPSVPHYGTLGALKVASFKAGHNKAMWQGIQAALATAPNGLTVAQIQAITTPNMGFANYCIKKCNVLAVQAPAPTVVPAPVAS